MSPRGVPSGEPPDEPDLDAQWRDIVARLGDLEDGAAPDRAPADEGRTDDVADEPPPEDGPERRATASPDPRSWAPDPAVEEAEEHFVPPDPGPVLGGDPLLTMAWVAVLAVPVLAIVALVAWRDIPGWLLEVSGVAFLLGLGVLLWRMPHHRPPGGEDDTGAVV
ncbi:hypothetical protein Q6348_12165 [Isoptericola sp. b441]|uniref:DUF308 domain-containing protein n=1 Tax=Actinotalea lenta TaxID=3064654 RepID=A0ABT9DBI2_9CELL|nr:MULTISPECIES: hypothetical protein [unclassified Isoptericola]MDO8107950.1 hypothetical protein [Isoptericola sp. b441]MDO8120383.1 hypothetical protein [Isoptericola sp. b490]